MPQSQQEPANFSEYTYPGLCVLFYNENGYRHRLFREYLAQPSTRSYKLFSIQRDFVEEIQAAIITRENTTIHQS